MTAASEIAQRLGHGACAVEETVSGHRWFGWCRCGYVSTTKTSEALAVGAVVHHVQAEIRQWQTTGRPATPAPEGDLGTGRGNASALGRPAATDPVTPRVDIGFRGAVTPRMPADRPVTVLPVEADH